MKAVAASGEVRDCHGELLYPFTGKDGQWCFPRPLDGMSPRLVNATLAAERAGEPPLPAVTRRRERLVAESARALRGERSGEPVPVGVGE